MVRIICIPLRTQSILCRDQQQRVLPSWIGRLCSLEKYVRTTAANTILSKGFCLGTRVAFVSLQAHRKRVENHIPFLMPEINRHGDTRANTDTGLTHIFNHMLLQRFTEGVLQGIPSTACRVPPDALLTRFKLSVYRQFSDEPSLVQPLERTLHMHECRIIRAIIIIRCWTGLLALLRNVQNSTCSFHLGKCCNCCARFSRALCNIQWITCRHVAVTAAWCRDKSKSWPVCTTQYTPSRLCIGQWMCMNHMDDSPFLHKDFKVWSDIIYQFDTISGILNIQNVQSH